jgi:hypothetical protein
MADALMQEHKSRGNKQSLNDKRHLCALLFLFVAGSLSEAGRLPVCAAGGGGAILFLPRHPSSFLPSLLRRQ